MPFVNDIDTKLKQLDEVLSKLTQLRSSLAERSLAISASNEHHSESDALDLQQLHKSLDVDFQTLGELEKVLRSLPIGN